MRDAASSPRLAAGLVFLSSAAVLVVEILGIRLLAPYVGLTLETTTAIIGTVLAGIAAGAAVGGRAADRADPRLLLPVMFAAGGALTIASVPLVRALGSALRGGGDVAALLVALTGLFPPAAALSAIPPAVAKVQLRDLGTTGSVVGRLSAWATTGGLVGTFVTGFVIVPLLPTDVAIFTLGGGLLVLALLLNRGGAPWSAETIALVVGSVLLGGAAVAVGAPCDAETRYHCAVIEDDPRRESGRTLVLEDLEHSYVDLADPRRLEFAYTRWIGDAIDGMAPRGAPLDAVFLGGAGFTLPRYLRATRPGSRSRVLEVDPVLVDLARERLGLRTRPGIRVRIGDARVTLADEPTDSADLLVGDAFGARAVPWHLSTVEFAREIRRVLRPDGLYALNVIDQPPLDLVRAQAATLLDVFGDVALVARAEGDGRVGPTGADAAGADPAAGTPAGGNLVLLASDRPIPAAARSTRRGARPLDRAALARFAAGADVLRDEDAPADQLLSRR